MEYTLKTVTILDVSIIDGEKIVNYWKEPMTMVMTDQGFYIDHLHHNKNWEDNLNKTIEITEATFRNSKVLHMHWGHIGKIKQKG